MAFFSRSVIKSAVNKLIKGQNYRAEIIRSIDIEFFSFALDFFKRIVNAKINGSQINLDWYSANFITNDQISVNDVATFAGTNKKSITNIKGSATKAVVLDFSKENFEYLSNMIQQLECDANNEINILIKITYKDVSVDLSLTESLLVINALATKKISIRGGAWSSIEKRVEKLLMLTLCEQCNVPKDFINSEVFVQNKELEFDRGVDFKLYNFDKTQEYRVEVKLMGKGNPESADAVIARNSNIFIADTLSRQNKNQLTKDRIKWLELLNNNDVTGDFVKILNALKIPNNC